MTAPQDDNGPKPTMVDHDPGIPEQYAGDPVDDGWETAQSNDPAEKGEGDGKLDPRPEPR